MYSFRGSILNRRLTRAQVLLFHELDLFIDHVGIQNIGFLTLRFYPKLRDKVKAQRKLKRFCDKVLAHHCGHWICTWERHRDGTLHVHLAIDCKVNILTGYDADLDTMGLANPNENLRRLRRVLHQNTMKYGFGGFRRHDLEPPWGRDSMISYLLNKLSCRKRRMAGKGMRLIKYSTGFSRYLNSKSKCMLLTPYNRRLRRFAGMVAAKLGCEDEDALAAVLGDWPKLLWMYRMEFQEWTNTNILDRLDEHRPGWRPSGEVKGENGQIHEVVHEVDEFLDTIAENHGYLRPRKSRKKERLPGPFDQVAAQDP